MRRVRTPVSIHLDFEGNAEWRERIELSCDGFADRVLTIRNPPHEQCVRRELNPRLLVGSQACCLNTSNAATSRADRSDSNRLSPDPHSGPSTTSGSASASPLARSNPPVLGKSDPPPLTALSFGL